MFAEENARQEETRMTDIPHRRHRLTLDLEADDHDELVNRLHEIGNQIDREERDTADITSGGWASGHHLTITTDPAMTGDRYRDLLAQWSADRRANR